MINRQRMVDTFLELVRIDSPSGSEQDVARYLTAQLVGLGFATEMDTAGNLFGKRSGRGEPMMLNAHMDSVQPCMGIKPVVDGDTIRSDGTTILGADDRTAVAAIVEVLRVVVEGNLPVPPLEVVFTVREELGLRGAKELDYTRLTAKLGIVLDHDGPAGGIVVAAPYQDRLEVTVHGKAAHAGGAPEKGISAIRVAAEAIAAMPLGRIDGETTSNIGIINGGMARNVVPPLVTIDGEARSRNAAKLDAQTGSMVKAFKDAAARHGATVDIKITRNYDGFHVTPQGSAVLRLMMAATKAAGIEPRLEESGGGSDVNIFRTHGIDALVMSCGFGAVHTTDEYQNIPEMVKAAQIVLKAIVIA